MASPYPRPTEPRFRGKSLKSYLTLLVDRLSADRVTVAPDSGLVVEETPGGRPLRVTLGNLIGFAVIKTNGTITARSGTTPGTGSAYIQTWSGTVLANGNSVTVRNVSGKAGGIGSGLYGFAVKLFGIWWVVSVECA
ncbi:MAG: hypothetical protein AB7G11_02775 [Phycisphaerales bacterium]